MGTLNMIRIENMPLECLNSASIHKLSANCFERDYLVYYCLWSAKYSGRMMDATDYRMGLRVNETGKDEYSRLMSVSEMFSHFALRFYLKTHLRSSFLQHDVYLLIFAER